MQRSRPPFRADHVGSLLRSAALKDALIVEFVKKPPGKASNGEMVDTPFYEVKYDFVLEQKQAALAAAE